MKSLAVLLMVAVCAVAVHAEIIPLVNGGFEEPDTGYDGGYTEAAVAVGGEAAPGWVVTQGNVWGGVQDAWGWETTEGKQSLWIQSNMLDDGYQSQTLTQITGSSAVEGQVYTLSFDATGRWDFASLKELTARILLDGVTVSSVTVDYLPAGQGWFSYSTAGYTATAADAGKTLGVELYFDNMDNPSWHAWTYIDNVTLTAVPEPASLVMLGLGALTLLRKRS